MDNAQRKKAKIVIDACMTAFLLLCMTVFNGLIILHEIFGFLLIAFFVSHAVFNFRYLRAVFPVAFNKKLNKRGRFDVIVMTIMISEILTVLITGCIVGFGTHPRVDYGLLAVLHKFFAYLLLITAAVHAGTKIPFARILKGKAAKSVLAAVAIVFVGISVYTYGFTKKSANFSQPFIYRYESEEGVSKYYAGEKTIDGEGNQMSLYDFLSRLRCGGCHKNCLLTALKCERGLSYKEAANVQYANSSPAADEPFTFPFPIDVISLFGAVLSVAVIIKTTSQMQSCKGN